MLRAIFSWQAWVAAVAIHPTLLCLRGYKLLLLKMLLLAWLWSHQTKLF